MIADRLRKDWTQGSVVGNLWSLAWPMIISQSITVIGPTIDMIWVGKLGSASVAGVGVAGMAVMAVNALQMGLFTGLRALVARFVGAGDTGSANHVAQQAFVIGISLSLLLALIGIFLAEEILVLFGVQADVVAEGGVYMRILFAGSATMSFTMISQSIMQASGDTVNPMRITIFFRILHIVLCPFLIFGWWIFPQLGVSGAALTNVITQSLGGILGFWLLFSGRTRLKLTFSNFRLDKNIIWRLLKIGIPASITGMQRNLPYLVLVWFISPFGTYAVAAHSVMQRIDNFMRTPAGTLGSAAGILAGQNLGAGQPERAEKGGWSAVLIYTSVAVVVAIVFLCLPESIMRIFNAESGFLEIASTFLKIQTIGYVLFGLVVGLSMCIDGIGATTMTMLATILTMWLVQIPLAYVLPNFTDLGVYGIQWAIVSALILRALIYAIYFRSGRWKRKKV
ncbi:MAG: MATE family efflux transporter [Dehalococcoidales bacterium]|nr:MAG: MATE family efflux transporter [Dehalococcoidales bacterium]